MTVEYCNSELVANIIDEKLCPFCNNSNSCGANTEEACWCFETKVPKALIELVPQTLSNKSCICINCIRQYHFDPENFKHQYLSE